jgi:hypothetical protein
MKIYPTRDTCIEVVKTFKNRANDLGLEEEDIRAYQKNIESQIELLS